MFKNMKRSRSGFSLMELMIVIVILGLLASVVMPSIMGKGAEAKKKLVCIQMKNVSEALKMFNVDNGIFPTLEEGLEALVENPDEEKYPNYASSAYFEDKKIPKDSWGHAFIYVNDEDDNYDIISLGADGKEGGKDDKEDVKFSECKF